MDSFEHALPAGTVIDERYRIDSVLGEGGFAITYKAFDTKLQCDVAIKEFLPNDLAARSSDTKTVQPRTNRNDDYSFGLNKFLDEARTLASLRHPHIVQVTNFIEANGTGYLVMAYDEGQELGEWLKTQLGQLSEESVLGIITPIIEGLTEVHQQGLLHRDIKPGNIFLRQKGGPMLIDFGAARQAVGEKSKSVSAIISQGYAPPEQYLTRGKQTPSTDLYAIGATVYHLITGKAPVESVERSHDVHEGDPDPMLPATEAGKGKVADWLLALTDQLLAISPKQRPQSAQAVLEAINNKTTAVIETASATSTAQNTNNKTRVIKDGERFASAATGQSSQVTKSKTGLYAGIAAAVLVAVGAGYFFTQQPANVLPANSKAEVAVTQKAKKSLAQGKAILFVESKPSGAEVYLDNQLLGKTPYQADNLPQGIYELTLKHEMSSDLTKSLQLTDNLLIKKSLTLKAATGNYSIFSTPAGAAVTIDGKDTGKQTPASLTGITAGEHTLTLSKDAYYPKKESIYIRKDENLRGDFTLEGGNLVQYKGKWIEPEEKTRLVAVAGKEKAEEAKRAAEEKRKAQVAKNKAAEAKRKAEIAKARGLRTEAKAKAAEGDVKTVEALLAQASTLVAEIKGDVSILAQARTEAKAQAEAEAEAEAKAQAEAKVRELGIKMISIPSGSFQMGSNSGSKNERPVHQVNIKAFKLGETEVTQKQWQAVMGSNPSGFKACDNCPVEQVSWDDVQSFIKKLNNKTGQRFRLPSEAEWEYACRSGGKDETYCGGENESGLAWYDANSGSKTHPVKQKQPNGLGLYDMNGNVYEWTQDCWNTNYNGAPTDGSVWTGGDCGVRVLRGGSWYNKPSNLRSADRFGNTVTVRYNRRGFRLAQDINDSHDELAQNKQAKREVAKRSQHKQQNELAAFENLVGKLIDIPEGSFLMGENSDQSMLKTDIPAHEVSIKAFKLGQTEVTQKQWQSIMGDNPSDDKSCDNCPVGNVNWHDVQTFIKKLNKKTGQHFRLPSEAEWEYACRSGGKDEKYCGGNDASVLGWYHPDAGRKAHSVAQKNPNGLGLYDMSGNVYEWTQDCWNKDYNGAPSNGEAWLTGDCAKRALRGGTWNNYIAATRSTWRDHPEGVPASTRLGWFGFRLAHN